MTPFSGGWRDLLLREEAAGCRSHSEVGSNRADFEDATEALYAHYTLYLTYLCIPATKKVTVNITQALRENYSIPTFIPVLKLEETWSLCISDWNTLSTFPTHFYADQRMRITFRLKAISILCWYCSQVSIKHFTGPKNAESRRDNAFSSSNSKSTHL